MNRIKVVLAGMPPMLADIVRDAIASQPDMDIVVASNQRADCRPMTGDIDVVIIGARQPDDFAIATRAFGSSATALVLAIAVNGRDATMWQLRPHPIQLGEVSAQSIVAAIRGGRPCS